MRTIWKRLSVSDVNRLAEKHNLNYVEREMLKRLCKGKTHVIIADETLYSVRTVKEYAKIIYSKIKDDLCNISK
jgi:DNA-binding CsgD family transcriptional regulator